MTKLSTVTRGWKEQYFGITISVDASEKVLLEAHVIKALVHFIIGSEKLLIFWCPAYYNQLQVMKSIEQKQKLHVTSKSCKEMTYSNSDILLS
jgi:hypothetical protein